MGRSLRTIPDADDCTVIRIYGFDFTSAPTRRKAITRAACWLENDHLHFEKLDRLPDWASFEAALNVPGPWVAGFDFPFGQPQKLLEALGWPLDWPAYVRLVGEMLPKEFEAILNAYRAPRPPGDKQHLRRTDALVRAASPMMLYGTPVAKMFQQGAPRLLKAGLNILPGHPNDDSRVALEVYPGLAARRFLGRTPYKNDDPRKQHAAQREARQRLLDAPFAAAYGLRLNNLHEPALLEDPSGDSLDALLAALSAAQAARLPNFGLPADVDAVEGWIAGIPDSFT